ncbi:hypothetical protein R1flu_027969 [Riccia fluitans]|uniref:Uncharacterized protein n=1 Tax=Riccia fluitans TaxID=41844 RepID=A0ABD1XKD6_9MARC
MSMSSRKSHRTSELSICLVLCLHLRFSQGLKKRLIEEKGSFGAPTSLVSDLFLWWTTVRRWDPIVYVFYDTDKVYGVWV